MNPLEQAASTPTADWPPILRHLASILGRERALQLAARFGGLPVYVPLRYSKDHLWASLVTANEWLAIAERYGRQTITLPRGVYIRATKRLVHELLAQGRKVREIAQTLSISQSHAYRILREIGVCVHSTITSQNASQSPNDDSRRGKATPKAKRVSVAPMRRNGKRVP